MSCYHPILGVPDREAGLTKNGKVKYKILGSYTPEYKTIIDPGCIAIPCGHCLGCRLDYTRSWSDRMALELESCNGKGVFITLTYNQENVRIAYDDETGEAFGYTLCKEDWQCFMKKLRSRKQFENKKLRFYSCGEYGKTTRRPHMHAIIFGLSLEDFPDRKERGMNELGQTYYQSDLLADIWSNGFCLLCDVSYQTCAYVARYVMKKAFPSDLSPFVQPEFSLMSRNPGIGKPYLEMHPDCLEWSKLWLSNGTEIRLPKYFIKTLEQSDPSRYEELMSQRKELANDAVMKKLLNTDLEFVAQLEIEEEKMYDRTSVLTKLRK